MTADRFNERFMREAIALARRGYGFVDPNPLVGAVIVQDGQIVARGFHEEYGHEHAERNALNEAAAKGVNLRGASMYVTLEPCSHYGHQPPCATAIAESGITEVFVGSDDPNPRVNGAGIAMLRAAGLRVVTHVLMRDCDALNDSFFHFIRTTGPWVVLKYAMSLDGRIALHDGTPWAVSGPESLQRVHEERSRYAAIVTGVGTVLADDPQLTARPSSPANPRLGVHSPWRIVMDSQLRTPVKSRVVQESRADHLTVLATTVTDAQAHRVYEDQGCTVVSLPGDDAGEVSVTALMDYLGHRRVDSALLECGGRLSAAFLRAGKVNKVEAFIAPKIVGNALSPSPVAGHAVLDPLPHLHDVQVSRCGHDVVIEGKV
ncbi:MAG: bifunctional diaminohydroxyphosphoribosylaminopyrimidine deaminase/5-amino-6-(5-phosphoribosylamino)uracil reductase RibD [Bifidobacteriaceae bacterium]|nr:bifunctional diaminohydroxyphosphoribosylaminopyrimidine deaminase/5-amino-6-(5-phosphoribosylamino)uracil reductase RibD [Bifidobacteriaceae bacterium]MCI1978814.1 bifunctional diaminohydroxyphosphoribosylaminopyrimidine deaminase/5-amino-6-(5-phosphoribosylamino)uracil reductase RibD [Bifidobacteriaceae bacterium]